MSLKDKIKIAKKYNPLKNKVKMDDGLELKWKIKNPHKKEKCSLTLEVTKDFEDVEFFAVVKGKPFLIEQNGIGTDFSEDAENIFSAKIGATKKF